MNKKVGMFVWNHFTNDARVLRECTALSENGYSVELFCIEDTNNPSLPKYENINHHFHVIRVREHPLLLGFIKKVSHLCMKNKLILAVSALFWFLMLCLMPFTVFLFSVIIFLFTKTKLNMFWIRASIMYRMILRGWKGNYDIYHSNDLNTLIQGYIGAKWRWKKRQLLYDSHEVQTSRTGYNSRLFGIIEAFLIHRVDQMIVENHTRAKYNEKIYGFYPNVVHNYPFKQEIHDQREAPLHQILGIPSTEKILLYQGGMQEGRGLDKLIKAAPLFSEGVLVFIGDGKMKPALELLVEKMKLQDKVKFLPKVPLKELPEYTRNAYIGFQVLNNVCFNHYSASSNKLFEYLMAGVPVVACSFPEIQRVVEKEKVGICIDSHDFQDIAFGVNFILENTKIHDEMKRNCFRASKNYNWETEKHKLLSTYSSLFGRIQSGGQLRESY
ncbi:glycosyltransferase [Heyndrickxia acidicola]|uniref:Glycosyltransferase n=1 Tax=Heyndrickxia acidicola TaxID=209389 RepID=A0ABU6MEE7_9BACI|nr:glycosyltransferase [Heyndrickxia acidicola]MED1202803.1 glycosyltransferase [Heyndrickxia acidicola]